MLERIVGNKYRYTTTSLVIVILIIVILLVVQFVLYVRSLYSRKKVDDFGPYDTREGFVPPPPPPPHPKSPINLDQPTSILYREKNAIQSCDALRSDDPKMSEMSQDTMRSILGSNRMNQWKPGEDEPLIDNIKNKTGHTYCYLYNDDENKMKDLRLFDKAGCSLQNPIFKDTPFIDNVYKSKYPDNTHTIPIEKCIIEIDPSKTSVENLDKYWRKWGDTECGHVTDPLRASLANKLEVLETMDKQMDELNKLLDEYNLLIDQTDLDITQCELSKESNQNILNDFISRYNAIYATFQDVDEDRSDAVERKSDMMREEKEIGERIDKKQVSYLDFLQKAEACDIQLQDCNRREAEVQEQLKIQLDTQMKNERVRDERQKERDEIQADHYALIGPESICQSALQSGKIELDETTENIERTTGLLNTCSVEREHNKNMMEIFQPRYERKRDMADRCLERERQLRIDNDKCQEQKKTCKFLTDEHKNTVQRFRDIRDRLLECEEKRAELNVVRRELEEQNVFHFNLLDSKYGELDDFERSLYEEEVKSSINNSEVVINKFRSDLDKMTTLHVEQSGCSAKAEFVKELNKKKNRNAELKYRIESLKSQSCYYCDPTISHCAEKFKNDKVLCSEKAADGSLLASEPQTPPRSSMPISTNRRCGPDYGTRCRPNQCCSRFGWCANSNDHCVRFRRTDSLYHGDGKE